MCVSDGSGAGLDYSDAPPSYFNLFTEPRTPRRMFENIGPGHGVESSKRRMYAIGRAAVETDAIGEKRTQSGSSSWSGRNRGVAAEADAIGRSSWSERKRRAAAEAGAIGEQQLEAEANREQQWMPQSGPGAASSWSGRNRGEAALHRELSGAGLRKLGEQGGSSWASEASSATCTYYPKHACLYTTVLPDLVLPRLYDDSYKLFHNREKSYKVLVWIGGATTLLVAAVATCW